jgi:hypothetical protein
VSSRKQYGSKQERTDEPTKCDSHFCYSLLSQDFLSKKEVALYFSVSIREFKAVARLLRVIGFFRLQFSFLTARQGEIVVKIYLMTQSHCLYEYNVLEFTFDTKITEKPHVRLAICFNDRHGCYRPWGLLTLAKCQRQKFYLDSLSAWVRAGGEQVMLITARHFLQRERGHEARWHEFLFFKVTTPIARATAAAIRVFVS